MVTEMTSTRLTRQQEAFCLFVLAGDNQSDAYRKAFNCRYMKAKTVHECASKLMAHPKVTARVAELMRPIIAKARLTREQWLEQLGRIVFCDPRKMFDAYGNPIEIPEQGDNEASAIAGFEFYEGFAGKGKERKAVGYTRKFRLADRLRALELYGKAQCYYAEKLELTGTDGVPIETTSTITVEFVRPERRPAEN
jgi:phage terminase small subunit